VDDVNHHCLSARPVPLLPTQTLATLAIALMPLQAKGQQQVCAAEKMRRLWRQKAAVLLLETQCQTADCYRRLQQERLR